MRRWGLVFGGVLGASAIVVWGCGLDESGLVPNDGAAGGPDSSNADADAGPADVFVPPTCSTIDASCLGAVVPSDWALLGVASGTASCPSADFDTVPLVDNPRLHADSCSCAGCIPQGAYACAGFVLKAGSSCGSTTMTVANGGPACVGISQSGSGANVAVTPNPPTGSPTCNITPTGTGAVDVDAVTGCRPNKCEADFCGLALSGLQRCIVHAGAVACPPGFSLRGANGLVGTAGTASCDPCGCKVAPGVCTGIFRVFDNVDTCDGDGGTNGNDYRGVYGADGGCNNVGNFNSIFYLPDPAPSPSCVPAQPLPNPGDAGLANAETVCCP